MKKTYIRPQIIAFDFNVKTCLKQISRCTEEMPGNLGERIVGPFDGSHNTIEFDNSWGDDDDVSAL